MFFSRPCYQFTSTISILGKSTNPCTFKESIDSTHFHSISSPISSKRVEAKSNLRSINRQNFKKPTSKHRQNFDYFLVLDFEATCDGDGPIMPFQEIIEFPVLKINAHTWEVESRFHHYVRPTSRPELTTFCTQLTGIIQEMVDGQPTLDEVLKKFDIWMEKEHLSDYRFSFVTCGDWDLQVMLPSEARQKSIMLPKYFSQWINVKKSYCDHTKQFAKGLKDLLKIFNLQTYGRIHSGIDDAANISAVTAALGQDGYIYRINGSTHNNFPKKRLFNGLSVS